MLACVQVLVCLCLCLCLCKTGFSRRTLSLYLHALSYSLSTSLSVDRPLQHLRCSSLAMWCVLYPSNIENAQIEYAHFVERYGTEGDETRRQTLQSIVYKLSISITSRINAALNVDKMPRLNF